jgi:hypothetical protein
MKLWVAVIAAVVALSCSKRGGGPRDREASAAPATQVVVPQPAVVTAPPPAPAPLWFRSNYTKEHKTDERGLVGVGRGDASPGGAALEFREAGNVREHT